MKSARIGTVSGCIVWFIVFGIISMCLLPVSMAVGGITSVSGPAIGITGGLLCPAGTTSKTRSYATTTTDEYGNSQPSTAYVLQCVDAAGVVVKEDPVAYSFIWIGILSGGGLILAGILAFIFAAPAGVIITRFVHRNKNKGEVLNIKPE